MTKPVFGVSDKDADQSPWMHKLVCAFAGHKPPGDRFSLFEGNPNSITLAMNSYLPTFHCTVNENFLFSIKILVFFKFKILFEMDI